MMTRVPVDPGESAVVHVVADGALRVPAAGEVVVVVGAHQRVVDAAQTDPAELMAGSGAVARRADPYLAVRNTVILAFRAAGELDGGVVHSGVTGLVVISVGSNRPARTAVCSASSEMQHGRGCGWRSAAQV